MAYIKICIQYLVPGLWKPCGEIFSLLCLEIKQTSILSEWSFHLLCREVVISGANLVPRAAVVFPQKASQPADTPGKRRPDLDKFCLAQTDVLRPLKFARSHRAGSVEELTVGVYC